MFDNFDVDLPGLGGPTQSNVVDKEFEGLLGHLPGTSGFFSQADADMEEQARQEIARLNAEEMGLQYDPPPPQRQPQRNVEVVRRNQTLQPQAGGFGRNQAASDSDDEMDSIIGDLDKKLMQKEEHFRQYDAPQQRQETPDFTRAQPTYGRHMTMEEQFLPVPQLQGSVSTAPAIGRRQTADPNRSFGGLSTIPEMGAKPSSAGAMHGFGNQQPGRRQSPYADQGLPQTPGMQHAQSAIDTIGTLSTVGSRRGRTTTAMPQFSDTQPQRSSSAGHGYSSTTSDYGQEGFNPLRQTKHSQMEPPMGRKSDEIKEVKEGQLIGRKDEDMFSGYTGNVTQSESGYGDRGVDLVEFGALKARCQMLEAELKKAVDEKASEIEAERDRLKKIHEKDLKDREEQNEANIKRQKEIFEKQLTALENSRKQQEKLTALADTVETNSKELVDLSHQLNKTKAYDEQKREEQLESRTRILTQLEGKIQTETRMLESDKEQLNALMRQLKENEDIRRANYDGDLERLREERKQLQDFNDYIKDQDRQRKEELLIEKQKLELLRETFESSKKAANEEIEEIKNQLILREKLAEEKQKELNALTESQRQEYIQKNNALENQRRKLSNMEIDITRKYQQADERERTTRYEQDSLQRTQDAFTIEKRKVEEEAMKVHQLGIKVQEESEIIAQAKAEIERDREEIARARYELVSKESAAKAEVKQAEHMRSDLALQLKTFEKMRSDYVTDLHTRPRTAMDHSVIFHDITHPSANISRDIHSKPHTPYKPYQPTQPRGVANKFSSEKFIKELENYERHRSNMQDFIVSESANLLSNRMQMDYHFSESLGSSNREYR